MKRHFLASLPFIAALSACGADIASEPVQFALKPGTDPGFIATTTTFPFRTHVTDAEGSFVRQEKGVTCVLETKELKATLVTPAKVAFPITRGRASPMVVRCANEDYVAEGVIQPGLSGTIVMGPSLAGVAAAVISAGVANARDRWAYANETVWITLEERGGQPES
ncbi:hypothetical protein A3731_02455 [Roseovarius sp. HI0049]|nr:hypothetical protein A3731_02455 [Roseovarius sp. HI0049]